MSSTPDYTPTSPSYHPSYANPIRSSTPESPVYDPDAISAYHKTNYKNANEWERDIGNHYSLPSSPGSSSSYSTSSSKKINYVHPERENRIEKRSSSTYPTPLLPPTDPRFASNPNHYERYPPVNYHHSAYDTPQKHYYQDHYHHHPIAYSHYPYQRTTTVRENEHHQHYSNTTRDYQHHHHYNNNNNKYSSTPYESNNGSEKQTQIKTNKDVVYPNDIIDSSNLSKEGNNNTNTNTTSNTKFYHFQCDCNNAWRSSSSRYENRPGKCNRCNRQIWAIETIGFAQHMQVLKVNQMKAQQGIVRITDKL